MRACRLLFASAFALTAHGSPPGDERSADAARPADPRQSDDHQSRQRSRLL